MISGERSRSPIIFAFDGSVSVSNPNITVPKSYGQTFEETQRCARASKPTVNVGMGLSSSGNLSVTLSQIPWGHSDLVPSVMDKVQLNFEKQYGRLEMQPAAEGTDRSFSVKIWGPDSDPLDVQKKLNVIFSNMNFSEVGFEASERKNILDRVLRIREQVLIGKAATRDLFEKITRLEEEVALLRARDQNREA
jgi:hypothetical protein